MTRKTTAFWIVMWVTAFAGAPGRAQDDPQTAVRQTVLAEFNKALSEGRLVEVGGTPAGTRADDLLKRMRPLLDLNDWETERGRLVDALRRPASLVVSRYTKGDEVPQAKADYDRCYILYKTSNELEPDAASEVRMWFCKGRAEYAAKNFDEAAKSLNESINADLKAGGKAGSYHYNALGVVYLLQGSIRDAKDQFGKAIANESTAWAYPRHNLALAYIEEGDYDRARQEYLDAIQKAEQPGSNQLTGYLHYNLGLIYYQLGKKKDAQRHYETALKLFLDQEALEKARGGLDRSAAFGDNAAEAYNALGALWKSQGKRKEAEEAYRNSLNKNPSLPAARHNLELLLGTSKGGGQP